MALLEVSGIDVFYGRVQAVRGATLSVDKGEVVALIGSNGAGKTTTLRTISGLIHPQRGTIIFNGSDITHTEPQKIVNLGICQSPEGRRLFTRMSVHDNLRMGAYTRRNGSEIKADMDRVFELFPRLKERLHVSGAGGAAGSIPDATLFSNASCVAGSNSPERRILSGRSCSYCPGGR